MNDKYTFKNILWTLSFIAAPISSAALGLFFLMGLAFLGFGAANETGAMENIDLRLVGICIFLFILSIAAIIAYFGNPRVGRLLNLLSLLPTALFYIIFSAWLHH